MTTLTTVTSPSELAALVAGKPDDDLVAMATEAGVEATVAHLFAAMAAAFVPERAAGQSAVAQWDITGPDGAHTWTVTIDAGACRADAGPAASARITLGMGLPDFLRFMAGEGNAMTAFMAGKLKVSGDVMFGPVMEGFFNRT